MALLNFRMQWADKVASGAKRQTIRRKRLREIRIGERLHLYTGLRTKHCKKLGEGDCKAVLSVNIGLGWDSLKVDGRELYPWECAEFAHADGFSNATEMVEWFRSLYDLPFEGVVIKW